MKTKIKFLGLASVALSATLLLSACGSDNGNNKESDSTKEKDGDVAKTEQVEQVLNFTTGSDIPTLEITQATDTVSFDVFNNVYEGLYRLDKDNNPINGIAESHEVSEDGLVYTFKLRDANWSNGDTVTAHDFEYGWKRMLDPNISAPYGYIMGDIKNANKAYAGEVSLDEVGIKAVDEKTLEVTLENPIPYFVSLTTFPAFYPQNEAFVSSQGEEYAINFDKLIFNGPFTLSDWKKEEGWTLTKNDSYWDSKTVKLNEVNYKVIKDVPTALNLYNIDKSDKVNLNSEFVEKYKGDTEFNSKLESVIFFLRLNQANEILENENIRRALALGFDKSQMTEHILSDGSVPANYIVPKGFTSHNNKDFRSAGDYLVPDTAKAQEYWNKGLEELGKTEVTLELLNYDNDTGVKIGNFLKSQLEKNLPGLTFTIKPMVFGDKLATEAAGEYDISISGWGPDYQDPMTFMDMWTSNNPYNQMNYSNEEFDEIIKNSKTTLLSDLDARWIKLQESEQILLEEDAAVIPMYQRGNSFLQRDKVNDVAYHQFGATVSFKWANVK